MSEVCIDEGEVHEPRKRGLFRRGEDGLTTLEWLLIVAAVAGLAALAVVLVQNVVDETAEQISGSSARVTAAKLAAAEVTANARADDVPASTLSGANKTAAETAATVAKYDDYKEACKRLEITYGDVEGLTVWWLNDLSMVPSTLADGTTVSFAVWNAQAPTYGCHIAVQ